MSEEMNNNTEIMPVDGDKKTGKKPIWLAAGAIAAVGIICAVLFGGKTDPKEAVIGAFKSIYAEGQTSALEEIFGLSELEKNLQTTSNFAELEVQFEDSSNADLQQLATGTLKVKGLCDTENKKTAVKMGVGYADMDLANLNVYVDEQQMIAAIPEFSKKAFTLNYENDIEKQIKESPMITKFLEESGTSADTLIDYIKTTGELSHAEERLFDIEGLWNRYKEGSRAIEDLKAAMIVEKGEKKSFSVNGKEENCSGYTVTLTKDALIQFLNTSKEFFLTDETLKKDAAEYLKLTMAQEINRTMFQSEDGTDLTAEEIQEKAWKSAEDEASQMIAELEKNMTDLHMTVYVTKAGKMASFDYDTTATISEQELKFYGTATFAGGYNMTANVNAVLNVENQEGKNVRFTLDKTGSYEAGKELKAHWTASAEADEERYAVDYDGVYSMTDCAYQMSLNLQANGENTASMTSDGLIQNLEKGKAFRVEMDSLRLKTNQISGAEDYIELSGSYGVGPLTETVEVPEGETFDVLAADENDWNAAGVEIMGNLFGLIMSMNQ